MLLRVVIVALLAVAVMVAIKDGRLLREAGLTGSCASTVTPAGQSGYWAACKRGKLSGRPDLSRQSCVSRGLAGKVEYWRCPAPVGSSQGT
jgi:hypothetical protein